MIKVLIEWLTQYEVKALRLRALTTLDEDEANRIVIERATRTGMDPLWILDDLIWAATWRLNHGMVRYET